MLAPTTLRILSFEEALSALHHGAAFVDLRPIPDYLGAHIPGSLALLYEFGPGMAARARDCIPLEVPLILLQTDVNMTNAAAALRGKGFNVLGRVYDAFARWGTPALESTEVLSRTERPAGVLLNVGDHGAPTPEDAEDVPAEKLWTRATEFVGAERVVVAAGAGVRAALCIGMLERAGVMDVALWRPAR